MKESLISILATIILISVIYFSVGVLAVEPAETPAPTCSKGDTDLDGAVSMSDVFIIQQHLAGFTVLEGEGLKNADFNGDENITMLDAIWVQKVVSGLIPVESEIVRIENLTTSVAELELQVGKTHLASVITYPQETTFGVLWHTSDPEVAIVDKNGLITAKGNGECLITCRAVFEGIEKSIIVKATTAVTGLELDKSHITLLKDQTENITAKISPQNASDKTLKWTSSDEKIATVDNKGVITAVRPGECTITCISSSKNISAACKVSVKASVASVSISETEISISEEETVTLRATVSPENAFDKTISWTSSNKKIATVNNNGEVTGVSPGTATITVKTDNGGKTASCLVTVEKKPFSDGIDVSYTKDEINKWYLTLVNKNTDSLGTDYSPSLSTVQGHSVSTDIVDPLTAMIDAAAAEGVYLKIVSAFRSYAVQEQTYKKQIRRCEANGLTGEEAEAKAGTVVAPPGHSEHQLGLALDFNSLLQSFEDTKEGQWLRHNAHKYGFILRYDKDRTDITGYIYEPWHFRYVSIGHATKIYEMGVTLEEYIDWLAAKS